MGEPTSGAGLLTGLVKGDNISYLGIDEIGRYLANISSGKNNGFQREIIDYIIKLFSKADQTFKSRQYANDKDNPPIEIHQPHFCCMGATVKERLEQACSSTEVIDGFLNRWLVFNNDTRPDDSSGEINTPPPRDLVAKIQNYIKENPIIKNNYGVPEPRIVSFTPEALVFFKNYKKKMIAKIDNEPFPINQLYARCGEHAEKVALILCDDICIGVSDIKSAIEIVQQSNLHISRFAGSISNSQHESDLLHILNVIKEYGQISQNRLTQLTRKISTRIRNEIIGQLLEAEEIESDKSGKKVIYKIVG
jgi:hypothetical protein